MARVLVVDDHEYWRELLEDILSGLGYDVSTAANRQEAIDHVKQSIESGEHFHLVTLDHNLVDSGGDSLGVIESQAVLEALKVYPAAIAVMVVSGRADTKSVRNYLRADFLDEDAPSGIVGLDYIEKNGFSIQEFKQIARDFDERVIARAQQPAAPAADDAAPEPAATPSKPALKGKAKATAEAKPAAEKGGVFISYSHLDAKWLDRLQRMLKPVTRNLTEIDVWDDTRIAKGALWRDEIEAALATAKVGILLVSDNFLNSDFVQTQELPVLLEAAEKHGLIILWIAVSPCLYEETEIASYQCVNNPAKPLSSYSRKTDADRELVAICQHIKAALTK